MKVCISQATNASAADYRELRGALADADVRVEQIDASALDALEASPNGLKCADVQLHLSEVKGSDGSVIALGLSRRFGGQVFLSQYPDAGRGTRAAPVGKTDTIMMVNSANPGRWDRCRINLQRCILRWFL
jgi:hypothetical protein